MDGSAPYNARSVEQVFRDFKGRRAGIIKALTADVEDFYQQCDPEKENLCLYGFPNEQWEVNLPAEEVPPEFPEPALGINFARDGMQEKTGYRWLLKRLFTIINDLPTIFEVVTEKKQVRTSGKSSGGGGGSRPKSNSKPHPTRYPKPGNPRKKDEMDDDEAAAGEEDDDDDEEHGETLCGACGENYASDEFWICCDVCERWFHGKCVKITPAKAEHIKQYKCPRAPAPSESALPKIH
ncbi:unnamed protein product [Spirodela intermedia]|uniref:PHD finger protein ALFIN-LIKE n=1 Tax=Spirodela intermedia TaxID=51605 RepID=A0A7I8IP36_SPIIN|nr:unnamed protein product [Spirodela intermedia]CAA6659343.1 unnamed protein product [Spirodela intermedia]